LPLRAPSRALACDRPKTVGASSRYDPIAPDPRDGLFVSALDRSAAGFHSAGERCAISSIAALGRPVMQRAAWMIATTLVLAGCGKSAGGPDPDEEPRVEVPPPDFALGGQTGSGRKGPCRDDAQCEQLAANVLSWFTQPRPVSPLLRSECVQPEPASEDREADEFEAGDECECTFMRADGGEPYWHAQYSDSSTSQVRLHEGLRHRFRDRAGVDFLEGVEFEGCDPARPAQSCQQLCERYEAGWHAAATRTYDVTVMHASCPRPGEEWCANVYRAEGQCYIDLGDNYGSEATERGPFDCSECAQTAQEVDERWSCRQPLCGGEPGDLDVAVGAGAGVDCAQR
jgi:hypothetical protein